MLQVRRARSVRRARGLNRLGWRGRRRQQEMESLPGLHVRQGDGILAGPPARRADRRLPEPESIAARDVDGRTRAMSISSSCAQSDRRAGLQDAEPVPSAIRSSGATANGRVGQQQLGFLQRSGRRAAGPESRRFAVRAGNHARACRRRTDVRPARLSGGVTRCSDPVPSDPGDGKF